MALALVERAARPIGGRLGLWKAVEYYVAIDRYRPEIIRMMQEATGLPASIGRLELDLLPAPRIRRMP